MRHCALLLLLTLLALHLAVSEVSECGQHAAQRCSTFCAPLAVANHTCPPRACQCEAADEKQTIQIGACLKFCSDISLDKCSTAADGIARTVACKPVVRSTVGDCAIPADPLQRTDCHYPVTPEWAAQLQVPHPEVFLLTLYQKGAVHKHAGVWALGTTTGGDQVFYHVATVPEYGSASNRGLAVDTLNQRLLVPHYSGKVYVFELVRTVPSQWWQPSLDGRYTIELPESLRSADGSLALEDVDVSGDGSALYVATQGGVHRCTFDASGRHIVEPCEQLHSLVSVVSPPSAGDSRVVSMAVAESSRVLLASRGPADELYYLENQIVYAGSKNRVVVGGAGGVPYFDSDFHLLPIDDLALDSGDGSLYMRDQLFDSLLQVDVASGRVRRARALGVVDAQKRPVGAMIDADPTFEHLYLVGDAAASDSAAAAHPMRLLRVNMCRRCAQWNDEPVTVANVHGVIDLAVARFDEASAATARFPPGGAPCPSASGGTTQAAVCEQCVMNEQCTWCRADSRAKELRPSDGGDARLIFATDGCRSVHECSASQSAPRAGGCPRCEVAPRDGLCEFAPGYEFVRAGSQCTAFTAGHLPFGAPESCRTALEADDAAAATLAADLRRCPTGSTFRADLDCVHSPLGAQLSENVTCSQVLAALMCSVNCVACRSTLPFLLCASLCHDAALLCPRTAQLGDACFGFSSACQAVDAPAACWADLRERSWTNSSLLDLMPAAPELPTPPAEVVEEHEASGDGVDQIAGGECESLVDHCAEQCSDAQFGVHTCGCNRDGQPVVSCFQFEPPRPCAALSAACARQCDHSTPTYCSCGLDEDGEHSVRYLCANGITNMFAVASDGSVGTNAPVMSTRAAEVVGPTAAADTGGSNTLAIGLAVALVLLLLGLGGFCLFVRHQKRGREQQELANAAVRRQRASGALEMSDTRRSKDRQSSRQSARQSVRQSVRQSTLRRSSRGHHKHVSAAYGSVSAAVQQPRAQYFQVPQYSQLPPAPMAPQQIRQQYARFPSAPAAASQTAYPQYGMIPRGRQPTGQQQQHYGLRPTF